jgi:hypothetical protein
MRRVKVDYATVGSGPDSHQLVLVSIIWHSV